MKKTIKIDFRHFPQGFDKKGNFFTKLLEEKYNVVISDKPDYVFFSVFGNEFNRVARKSSFIKRISPKLHEIMKKSILWEIFKNSKFGRMHYQKKLPIVDGKFVKIFYTGENVIPDMSKCDLAFGVNLEEDVKNKKYVRLPCYLWSLDIHTLLKKNKTKKTKFCNFIYSNDCYTRNNFFKRLSKYKRVDAPGKCMNNMPPIDSATPEESRGKTNWEQKKINFLKDYKFTISFENTITEGYSTEKITNPMGAGSIPIYYGNPRIAEEFNEESFLILKSTKKKDIRELITKIIEIDQDDKLYDEILKRPWFKNNKPNKYCDRKRILKKLVKIIEK